MLLKVRCLLMSRPFQVSGLMMPKAQCQLNSFCRGNFRSMLENRWKEPDEHTVEVIFLFAGITVWSSVWCAGSVSGIGLIWALHVSTAILRLFGLFLSFGFSFSCSFCCLVLKAICSSGIKIIIDIKLKNKHYSVSSYISQRAEAEEAACGCNGLGISFYFLLGIFPNLMLSVPTWIECIQRQVSDMRFLKM